MPTLYETLSKTIKQNDLDSYDAYVVLIDALLEGRAGTKAKLVSLGDLPSSKGVYALVTRNESVTFIGQLFEYIVLEKLSVNNPLIPIVFPHARKAYEQFMWLWEGGLTISQVNTEKLTALSSISTAVTASRQNLSLYTRKYPLAEVWCHFIALPNNPKAYTYKKRYQSTTE